MYEVVKTNSEIRLKMPLLSRQGWDIYSRLFHPGDSFNTAFSYIESFYCTVGSYVDEEAYTTSPSTMVIFLYKHPFSKNSI